MVFVWDSDKNKLIFWGDPACQNGPKCRKDVEHY